MSDRSGVANDTTYFPSHRLAAVWRSPANAACSTHEPGLALNARDVGS